MSMEIDERVVQMRFENSDFDKKVKATLDSVDKLDKGLTFGGAIQGAENLTKSIVQITAVATITNKAINSIERFLKSVTLEPLTSGWKKYEEKTKSVQTIMAATGLTIGEVNEQLDKLNWFTDETSYSLSDMTNNIGKFTSQGVKLGTAVKAMEGIATWASLSGQGVNEASRAMYNLSQALGVGSVKLMDWKSIENANMATKEFKEQAMEAAVAEGTLKKEVDATGKAIYRTLKGTKVTAANFSQTLSEAWFTSNALLKVLENYGSFADELNGLYDSMADGSEKSTSEIIDDLKQLRNATDEDILAAGYLAEQLPTFHKLANELDTIGAKAFAAAQEAKTLTEALDSVKEAVATGWMKTYEIIFGNYTQAKVLWTDLANELWDIFASGAEERNRILAGGLQAEGNVNKIVSDMLGLPEKAVDKLREMGDELGYLDEDFQEIILEVTKGDKANAQLLTNVLSATASVESFNSTLEKTTGISSEELDTLVDIGRQYGTTSSQYNAYLKKMSKGNDIIAKQIDYLAKIRDSIDRMSGRDLLVKSFINLLHSLSAILETVKGAFHDIFPKATADQIYGGIYAFSKFIESITLSEEKLEPLRATLRGVFAILDVGFYVVKTVTKAIIRILSPIGKLISALFDVTGGVGDVLVGFRDIIKESDILGKALEPVVFILQNALQLVVDGIKILTSALRTYVLTAKNMELLKKGLNKLVDVLKYIGMKIWPVIESMLTVAAIALGGLVAIIKTLFELMKPVISSIKDATVDSFNTIKKFLPAIDGVEKVSENAASGLDIFARAIAAVVNGCTIATQAIGGFVDKVKNKLESSPVWKKISEFAVKLFGVLKSLAEYILPKIKDIILVIVMELQRAWNVNGIFSFLELLLGGGLVALVFNGNKMLRSLTEMLEEMGDAFESISRAINARALHALATAILEIVIAMAIIGRVPEEQLERSKDVMIAFAIALTSALVLTGIIAKVAGKANMKATNKILKEFAILTLIMALITNKVAKMEVGDILKSLLVLGALTLFTMALIETVATTNKMFGTRGLKKNFTLLTLAIIMFTAMYLVVKPLSEIPEDDLIKAGITIAALAGVLLVTETLMRLISKITVSKARLRTALSLIISTAGALSLLAADVVALGQLKTEKMWWAVGAIEALAGILVTMQLLMTVMAKNSLGKSGKEKLKSELEIFGSIVGALTVLTGDVYLLAQIDTNTMWGAVGAVGALSALLLVVTGAMYWISNNDKLKSTSGKLKDTMKVIGVFIGALSVMVAEVVGLSFLAPGTAGKAVGTIIALSGVLVAVVASLYYISNNADVLKTTSGKLKDVMKIVGTVVTALTALSVDVAIIGQLDPGAAGRAVGAIAGLSGILAALTTAMLVIVQAFDNTSVKDLSTTIVMMGAVTAVLAALSIVVLALGQLDEGAAGRAVGALAGLSGIIIGLTNAMLMLSKMFSSVSASDLATVFVTMGVMTGVLTIMSAVVFILAQLDPGAAGRAVGTIAALGGIMLGFVTLLGVLAGLSMFVGGPAVIIAMAAALEIVALSMVTGAIALAIAVGSLTKLAEGIDALSKTATSWEALGAIVGSLSALAIGLTLMSAAVPGAIALVIVAGSLVDLAEGIKALSDATIGKGTFGAIVGTLTALGIGLTTMTVALPGALALVVVADSLVSLAEGIKALSETQTSWAALGAILGTLVALGVGLTVVGIGLSAALIALGMGLKFFAKGAIGVAVLAGLVAVLAIGVATFAAIPAIMNKLVEAIVNFQTIDAISFIKKLALVTLPLAAALTALAIALIPAAVAVAGFGISLVSLAGGISAVAGSIVLVEKAIKAIISDVPNLWEALKSTGGYLIEGLQNGIKSGVDAVSQVVGNITDKIKGLFQKDLDVHSPSKFTAWLGKMLMDGLNKGLTKNEKSVLKTTGKIGDDVIDTMANALGVHSPSVKTMAMGKNTIAGFTIGEVDSEPEALDVTKSVGEDIIEAFAGGIGIDNYGSFHMENDVSKLMGSETVDSYEKGFSQNAETVGQKIEDTINKYLNPFEIGLNSIEDLFSYSGLTAAENYFEAFDKNFTTGAKDYAGKIFSAVAPIVDPLKELNIIDETYFTEYAKYLQRNVWSLFGNVNDSEYKGYFQLLDEWKANAKGYSDNVIKYIESLGLSGAGLMSVLLGKDATAEAVADFNANWEAYVEGYEKASSKSLSQIYNNVADQIARYNNWDKTVKQIAAMEVGVSTDALVAYIKDQGYENSELATAIGYALESLNDEAVSSQVKEEIRQQLFEIVKYYNDALLSSDDMLANMKSNVDGRKAWSEKLTYLLGLGNVSPELLQYFKSLGPENSAYLDAYYEGLMEAADAGEMTKYIRNFNEKFAESMYSSLTVEDLLFEAATNLESASKWDDAQKKLADLVDTGKISQELYRKLLSLGPAGMGAIDEIFDDLADGFSVGVNKLEDSIKANNQITTDRLFRDLADRKRLADEYVALYTELANSDRVQGRVNLEYLDELADMPVEDAVEWMRVISKMSAEEIKTLNETSESTKKWIGEQVAEFEKMYDKLPEDNAAVKEDFKTSVDEVEGYTSESISRIREQYLNVFKPDTFHSAYAYDKATEDGKNVLAGLTDGIEKNTASTFNAMTNLGSHMQNIFCTMMEIHSPSQVFEEFGGYIVQGLANGISEQSDIAVDSAKEMGEDVLEEVRSIIAKVYDVLSTNADFTPVITPVLDLSDVKKEAAKLSTILSNNSAVAASNTVNKSAGNFADIQNGSGSASNQATYNFTQNNYSPKALSRIDIYRQTNNQFTAMQRMVQV